MTDPHVRRTIHRGVAVVSILLSVVLFELDSLTAEAGFSTRPLSVERLLATVTLVVASAYLVVSLTRQLARAADTPF